MDPPRPEFDVPEPMYKAPLFPLILLPDPKTTRPPLPRDEDPELKTIDPLTPAAAPSAVFKINEPLLVFDP